MDTPIIYKGESSQLSKKTLEINNGNILRFSTCTSIAALSFFLSIIFIPKLLGKIICPVITVIVYIISLYMIERKIEILKDSLNKKIIVKIMNYLCRAKTTLIFDQENIHFSKFHSATYIIKEPFYKKTIVSYHTFYIINDYKNLEDIDLYKSNIRQKPAKYIYTFKNVYLGYEDCDFVKLIEFVGDSGVSNLFTFDINSYLVDKNIKVDNDIKAKYNYFSEHFFSYELIIEKKEKLSPCQICLLMIATFVGIFVTMFLAAGIMLIIDGSYSGGLISLMIFAVSVLLFYFTYKCYKYFEGNIIRIDFIFSKDFNTLFIGLVKYTQTKYVATFEFQTNNINKFLYERVDNNFNLKVQFKNNETQQICTLKKKTQEELEVLICFLNGGFMTHTHN